MNAHLSDDDLDDLLIGAASPEAEHHLDQCAACATRKAEFTAAVSSFNHATLAWSEAKSNTLTRELIATPRASTPRLTLAAAALCAAVLVASLLSSALPWNPAPRQAASNPATQIHTHAANEIANDDAMLEAIATEIYRPIPSPEQVYQIAAPSHRSPSTSQVRE